jgi:hypothetical protein
MKNRVILALWALALLAPLPAAAADGIPGATVKSEGVHPFSAERQARREKWCAENPEKCKELRARMEQRREYCRANPEQCRKERQARVAERFKKADADGNGALSRAEAEKGMPRLARHFDSIDADRDGQITVDEIMAARKARGVRKGRSL